MRYCLLSIVFLFLLSCTNKKTDTQLTSKVDSIFAKVKDFNGALLIADHGKVIYHKAFGFNNFDTMEPLDTTSIFELASVSKQFTAMVIMMLKEEGKLSYDDLLEKYIPGLPYKGITIRHLLTHTSGLPDYMAVMDQYWDKTKVAGNEECIEYLKKYHPAASFTPGEKFEYSNTGYMLLASVAEKASGIDFISFARTRIFVPLEMTSTDIRSQDEKTMLRNMAWGYIWLAEKDPARSRYVRTDSLIQFNYGAWLGNRKGPGRISSTTTDLLKWDQSLYQDALVSAETLNEAFSPMKLNNNTTSDYGFGWMLKSSSLGKVVHHSGSNPGYNTHIVRYIDAGKTIIILCNNAHPEFKEILNEIESVVESNFEGKGRV